VFGEKNMSRAANMFDGVKLLREADK